ncbi:MAG: fatty acid cis/trans isomerase [Burkholderiales bacterium]
MHKYLFLWLVILLSGCAGLAVKQFDQLYGKPDAARYDRPRAGGSVSYWQDVKPVFESRCIVCHACYDAPCQLKLTSYEGLARGANIEQVYNGERLIASTLTRMFEDAHSTVEWRQKDFFPVLNERDDNPQANIDGSVLAQMLLLKQDNPLPQQDILPESFDLGLSRQQQCTQIEQFADYRKKYPLWGMPYGLPEIGATERDLLLQWVREGAPYESKPGVSPAQQKQIDTWEAFFNQDSLKAQLMSRYMFEHLYLAHLYFGDLDGKPAYFQLVRSATPPGQPLQQIATRRPYDDPGVARVFYRLQPLREAVVVKTHMPYRLDRQRLARWRELFLKPDYQVSSLPSYQPERASNPFVTFQQLPSDARYRFMLDEAQFTIMGFIKGPVCRGQLALNVINDYFWVTFVAPDKAGAELDSDFMAQQLQSMSQPADSTTGLLRWVNYAKQEKAFLKAKVDYANQHLQNVPLDLNLLWNGDGRNDNAALTIYRHFDSASVVKGLQGDAPQTAWVVNYPVLERIHYLLVASYDVYGNVGHQLGSRIYMDFLRMEGEFSFLALLPKEARSKVRQHWYRGSVSEVSQYVAEYAAGFDINSDIKYRTGQPLAELYGMLKQSMRPVASREHALENGFRDAASLSALQQINRISGRAAVLLPQNAFVAVEDDQSGQTHYYTLLQHSAYTNLSQIFSEAERRLPDEDRISMVYGFVGSYPAALLRLKRSQLPQLARQLQALQSEADYRALLDTFGVRRTNGKFWAFSDRLHADFQNRYPLQAGWFDYNRLENR